MKSSWMSSTQLALVSAVIAALQATSSVADIFAPKTARPDSLRDPSYWIELLELGDVELIEQKSEQSDDTGTEAIEFVFDDRSRVQIDKTTGELLKYSSAIVEEVDPKLTHIDGINEQVAFWIADEFLRKFGVRANGFAYKLSILDPTRGNPDSPNDLAGAWWVYRVRHTIDGIPTHGMGFSVAVSAFSGAIVSFHNMPLIQPAMTQPQVTREQAAEKASAFMDDLARASTYSFRETPTLVVISSHMLFELTKVSTAGMDPALLCWDVTCKVSEDSEPRNGGVIRVYIDAVTGEVRGQF